MSSVLKAQNLKLNNVTFSDTKPLNIPGAKLAYINLNGGKIIVQGPKMRTTSGVRRWLNEENGKYDYDMELSFDDNSQDLLQKNQELDTIIRNKIKEKSKEWLGKDSISDELLDDKYKPIVKLNNNIKLKNGDVKDFSPSFVLKLTADQESNKFQSSKDVELLFFDDNKTKMDVLADDFVKNDRFDTHRVLSGNTYIIPVYEVSFLSFTKTSIKPRLKLVQAKVFPNKANVINSYVMDDEDENDVQDDLDTDGDKNVEVSEVEEVDVEEEEEVEVEEVSEEEVKPVKRGRGKKTSAVVL